jgi:hypothetical protein
VGVVRQFCVTLENRPGALAELCSELGKRAVNITAISGSEPQRGNAIRVLAHPPDTARRVLESLQLQFTEEPAIGVHLAERPGALGRVTRKLADAGINIEYIYGTIERNSQRALIVVGVKDVAAASKVVK